MFRADPVLTESGQQVVSVQCEELRVISPQAAGDWVVRTDCTGLSQRLRGLKLNAMGDGF